ncbi:MAG: cytochrome-c peroxidase [Bacteroidetes bacterium]|nr:cytochrome-c peroxidase [Bacteroidota bacterium]
MKKFIFIAFFLILIAGGWRYYTDETKTKVAVLCSTCPPGFEQTEDNRCRFRSLYQMYETKDGNNPGVGGLKTALPAVRDGFTPQQIDLGRYLFFDPALSGNGTVSCASCHQPDKGFSDGLPTSVGIKHTPLKRAAPSLWNVAFNKRFFWDARASTLEEQMTGPLYSPEEMGTTPEQLQKTLNNFSTYRELFRQAFPHKKNDRVELSEVYTCIAAFEATLISLNSRYDQYAHGYPDALTKNEIEGLNIFRSFVARCTECHTPPLFTNQQVAVIGLAEPDHSFDAGAAKTFNDPTLRGAFKVPSLRNAALTAPYTHSGRFEKLEDMIAFYTKGRGHEVPPTEKLRIHWHIWEPHLRHDEIDRIADFIHALTDESFKPQIPEWLPSGIKMETKQPGNSLSLNQP